MLEDVEVRLTIERSERYERGRAEHLRRTYGITLEQYDEMVAEQNGVCAICHEVCNTGKRLAVDHNHDTGEVRGLLCSRCNLGIGYLRNVSNLANSIVYLEKYKEST